MEKKKTLRIYKNPSNINLFKKYQRRKRLLQCYFCLIYLSSGGRTKITHKEKILASKMLNIGYESIKKLLHELEKERLIIKDRLIRKEGTFLFNKRNCTMISFRNGKYFCLPLKCQGVSIFHTKFPFVEFVEKCLNEENSHPKHEKEDFPVSLKTRKNRFKLFNEHLEETKKIALNKKKVFLKTNQNLPEFKDNKLSIKKTTKGFIDSSYEFKGNYLIKKKIKLARGLEIDYFESKLTRLGKKNKYMKVLVHKGKLYTWHSGLKMYVPAFLNKNDGSPLAEEINSIDRLEQRRKQQIVIDKTREITRKQQALKEERKNRTTKINAFAMYKKELKRINEKNRS